MKLQEHQLPFFVSAPFIIWGWVASSYADLCSDIEENLLLFSSLSYRITAFLLPRDAFALLSLRWNFLPLKYWATRSYKKAKCHAEYSTSLFGIISLSAKRLGLTFSVYWLETFFVSPPLLQKRGSVMLQEAATWHLVLSPALSLERMRSAARGGVISLSTFEFTK